jgi:polyferredoxin
MGLIQLILILAILGFALWLLITYVPMPAPIKTVIMAIAAVGLIILLLQTVGVHTGLENVRL